MKNKYILITIICIAILALGIAFFKYKSLKSKNSTKHFIEKIMGKQVEDITIENEQDKIGVGWILCLALEGGCPYDRLKLSSNFKNKYKTPQSIIGDIDSYCMLESGHDSDFAEYNRYTVWIRGDKYENIFNTLRYGEPVSTVFIFEYKIDENNLLDDVKLIRRKDVYSLTGERVDGGKEVTYDALSPYIHKLANPANPNVSEFFADIPLAKDCKILNKPNLEELGTPLNSICELSKEQLTLTFIYPSYKKVWNVKYNIDLDYKLDYIEFVEGA